MVSSLKNLPYPQRLKRLGLPSLEYRRRRADILEVFKMKNGFVRTGGQLFPGPPPMSQRLRGHPQKIHKTRSNTETRRAAFSQRVIDDWNSLHETVVGAPSINAFKGRLNKFWTGVPEKFDPECLH